MKVFLAGATGVVGRRLAVLLRRAGHEVAGTTRSEAKAAALQAIGAVPVLVDAYDADKLKLAVYAVQPDVIIHQLTDLPQAIDPKTLAAALEANARLRITGTRNLVDAALTNGVRRLIAQSIAFAYAPGQNPFTEDHPLDPAQAGVIALEQAVTQTRGIDGTVLRYGRLYGPGTWTDTAKGPAPLHVDAAAQAALLALTKGASGI
jgi:nucleoside-diphosphate-sugar epimerase